MLYSLKYHSYVLWFQDRHGIQMGNGIIVCHEEILMMWCGSPNGRIDVDILDIHA